MRVTSVVITVSKNFKNGLLAYASIQLDNAFRVSSIRIVENEGKRIVAMPSRQCPDQVYRDVAYPITNSMRDEINREVLKAYLKAIAPGQPKDGIGATV